MGGKSGGTTVGYWYELAIHFGLGIGPFDTYLEFRGGDKTAWAGSATHSQSIQINAPNLWGGEKDQGGIVGTLDLMFGEADQQPSARLAAIFGPQQPAWRGLATAVFAGKYGAMNPYPQRAAHKICRIKAGWSGECWYPEKAAIIYRTFSAAGRPWRYLVVLNSDTTDRSAPGFDDSGWGIGYAPFASAPWDKPGDYGFGTTPATVVPDGHKVWMRTTVSFTKAPVGARFQAFVDNDCRLYINGTLAAAVGAYNGAYYDVAIADGLFIDGENHIAVEGWDRHSGTGNWFWFDWRIPMIQGAMSMNAAHALYYARTNSDIGRVPTARLNDASYRAAADKLYAEGFGVCTSYDPSSESLEEFEQRLCRLIGGSVSRSLIDGQYYLDLARGDYVLDELPIITDDDILDISIQPSVPNGAINSVAVKYFDPERKETITTPPVQALSLIDTFGEISQISEYPEIPEGSLALRVAERDVRASTTPAHTMELTVIPDAVQGIRPNQYFRLQSAKRRIIDMVCLMGDRQAGTLKSGAVRITATEDIYSLPATSFADIEPGVDTRPDPTPNPITLQSAFEAPYIELVQRLDRANLDVLPADAGYLLAVADQPPGGRSYGLTVAAAGGEFETSATGDWCPFATVAGDATVVYSRDATSIPISAIQRGEQLVIGAAALWDSEIVRIDAIDIVAGAVVLGRGCADTVAAEHAGGSLLWLYDAAAVSDLVEYTDGESIDVRLLTNTGSAQLAPSAAAPMTVEFAGRQARPYPPGNLQLNGERFPVSVVGDLEVSFAHRDRVLQADQLIDFSAGDIGPEPGTTYTLEIYDKANGALVYSQTGITASPVVVPSADLATQSRLELYAVRDGIESWQRATCEFVVGFVIVPDLPVAMIGRPYVGTLTAFGAAPPVTWSVISGSLPPGISLGTPGSDVLPIGGTATTAGSYTFEVEAVDSNGAPSVSTFTMAAGTLVTHLRFEGADGSTTFTDESGKAWSRGGSAQISTAQAAAGGSSYLGPPGTSSSISTSYHADFNLSTEDFTIEAWVRRTGAEARALYGTIISKRAGGGDFDWAIYYNRNGTPTGTFVFAFGVTGTARINLWSAESLIYPDVWTHVAVSRRGQVVRMFVNGVMTAETTFAGSIRNRSIETTIGRSQTYTDSYHVGWLDDVRVIKGSALYWDNFAPPGAPP